MCESFATVPIGVQVQPEPYILRVPNHQLHEFNLLLKASKIAPETFENLQSNGTFGVSRQWLSDAKETWLDKFDWRAQEKYINSIPNFMMPVQDSQSGDFNIHFAALFSAKKEAIPIIFMHGWPGSFLEFIPILELLSKKYTPDTLPYHIIVPSLPGFAMSSGPPLDKDFTLIDAARVLNQLMVNLGFGNGYVAQGGDIGSMLARIMSSEHKECKAFHVNVFVLFPTELQDPSTLSARETKEYERSQGFSATGYAYGMEQATKPATVGLSISASPLGLLAWVGEKFIDWAGDPLPLETILTFAALYWYTSTFPRSIYSYRYALGLAGAGQTLPTSKEKPFGFSDFPLEISASPRSWIEAIYPNLSFWSEHEKGGHFAALEEPSLLLADVEAFVETVKVMFRA